MSDGVPSYLSTAGNDSCQSWASKGQERNTSLDHLGYRYSVRLMKGNTTKQLFKANEWKIEQRVTPRCNTKGKERQVKRADRPDL